MSHMCVHVCTCISQRSNKVVSSWCRVWVHWLASVHACLRAVAAMQVEGLQNTRRHSALPPEPPSTPTQSSEGGSLLAHHALSTPSALSTPMSGACVGVRE